MHTVYSVHIPYKIQVYFIRPTGNSTYKIALTLDPLGINLLIRLWLSFSRLKIYDPLGIKLLIRQNFADSLNPLCSCSLETECTLHFFLRC